MPLDMLGPELLCVSTIFVGIIGIFPEFYFKNCLKTYDFVVLSFSVHASMQSISEATHQSSIIDQQSVHRTTKQTIIQP